MDEEQVLSSVFAWLPWSAAGISLSQNLAYITGPLGKDRVTIKRHDTEEGEIA